jgi:hypothetical protein
MAFTLVFDGSIRAFGKNPLATETPYGVPYGAGIGDLMERAEILREAMEKIADDRDAPSDIVVFAKDAIRRADETIMAGNAT